MRSTTSLREDEGGSALLAEHRAGLVPLLVRLLFPKMRKRSGRLGGKGGWATGMAGVEARSECDEFSCVTSSAACSCTLPLHPTPCIPPHPLAHTHPCPTPHPPTTAGAPGSARAAILNFLASAEPHELRPLLELFLAPLSAAFVRPAGEAEQRELEALVGQDDPDAYRCGGRHGGLMEMQPVGMWLAFCGVLAVPAAARRPRGLVVDGCPAACPCRLIEGPWWGRCLGRQPGAWWLAHIDAAALNAEPLRKRIGYLNTLEDLLKHLGHRMQVRRVHDVLARAMHVSFVPARHAGYGMLSRTLCRSPVPRSSLIAGLPS